MGTIMAVENEKSLKPYENASEMIKDIMN